MKLSQKNTILSILVLIASFGFYTVWGFLLIPEYEKLPSDYSVYIEHEGEDRIEEARFQGLSTPFRLQEVLIQEVINENGDELEIKSNVIGYRAENKEKIFDSERVYKVNRYTLTHSESGKLFGFLPNVEKRNYDSFHPLVFQDATLIFEKEDKIHDFETFVFYAETKNDDYTFAFKQYAPFEVLGDSFARLWVEPKTGTLIKFEQNWEIFIINNEEKQIIEKGWKKTTPFTESILIEHTQIKLENRFYFKYFIPIIFSVLIFSLGMAFIFWNNYHTAKRQTEKQEKINIIGGVASRFAHDIRNPLSNINMAIELIKKKHASDIRNSEKEKIETIEKNLDRINHQVDNVLNFIRSPILEKTNLDLAKSIKESMDSLKIPENIKITFPKKPIMIFADPFHIQIVFKNLILNSIQAIGKKEGWIQFIFNSYRQYDIIKIIDSGDGVQQMDLIDIFEPLTTTKQEGTGLGLVSCKNIIESHGGTIHVKNNPTTFTIKLPKN